MANNWRGCKDIEMIWHGEWNDPELVTEYDGVEYWFNYYDIEDTLWEMFLEENELTPAEGDSGNYEDAFNKYCQDNAYTYITYDLIPSLDSDNYTKDGKKWFWIDRDVADYNAYLDSDEDDFDYDDIEESCGDGNKKKNKRKRKVNEAMGWKIKLISGKALRQAIDSEDKVAVLEALKDCWEEIHKKMPDNYDEYDLQNDLDDIENQIDNAENYDEYDMTEDDVEEEVNYLLSEFYDFCDGFRIWVEL